MAKTAPIVRLGPGEAHEVARQPAASHCRGRSSSIFRVCGTTTSNEGTSSVNLFAAIERARQRPLYPVLNGLGIRHVEEQTAIDLASSLAQAMPPADGESDAAWTGRVAERPVLRVRGGVDRRVWCRGRSGGEHAASSVTSTAGRYCVAWSMRALPPKRRNRGRCGCRRKARCWEKPMVVTGTLPSLSRGKRQRRRSVQLVATRRVRSVPTTLP